MSAYGKHIFIWKVPALLMGDPQRIGEAALAAEIRILIVKFVNGTVVYTPSGYLSWGINLKEEHVRLWQSMGLLVWGFTYLLGKNPTQEAQVAANEAVRLGLDGVAFDVEIEFETAQLVAAAQGAQILFVEVRPTVSTSLQLRATMFSMIERQPVPPQALIKSPFELQANPAGNAQTYMRKFKEIAPNLPTAFICFPLFRSPTSGGTWHDKPMYAAFMAHCDVGMPMTYWWGSTVANMRWMLDNSLEQWAEVSQGKPIIPIGRLYTGDGGTATAEAIAAFGAGLHARGLLGGGGWRMGTGIANAGWWNAFSNWPAWQIQPPQPPPTAPLDEWARHADEFLRTKGYTGPRPPEA